MILTRHLESSKNIDDRFAVSEGAEELTDEGDAESNVLASELAEFVGFLGANAPVVFSSNSLRAVSSAKAICAELSCPAFIDDALGSIVVPSTAGLSMAEFIASDPEAAQELNLYRAGLFDSYRMRSTGALVYQFEERVMGAVERITHRVDDVAIVLAHRSAISAILLHAARQSSDYPEAFFGFVPIDFGATALVEMDGSALKIKFANIRPSELNTIGRVFATVQ